jgi:hypothetical protein
VYPPQNESVSELTALTNDIEDATGTCDAARRALFQLLQDRDVSRSAYYLGRAKVDSNMEYIAKLKITKLPWSH